MSPPTHIRELLGQQTHVQRLLAKAVEGELHHCYLFEGPPGVGKYSAALGLAQAAACEAEPGLRPCGSCPNCRQIASGTHPDVLTLLPDPKRKTVTIGVGQVRELIAKLRLRRYSARWRSVIVDPADALMPQAANALLKTLEEPPDGTGFFLCTARVSALLPTVKSRSQRIRFRAVAEAELVPWLEARGIDDALRMARLSMGRPGRALELAQGAVEELDASRAQILEVIANGPQQLFALSERVSKGKNSRADVERLLESLELLLRDGVLAVNGREGQLVHPADVELARVWGTALWPRGISRLQAEIDQTRQRMQVNVNARLLIEALLSRVATELGGARRAAGGAA